MIASLESTMNMSNDVNDKEDKNGNDGVLDHHDNDNDGSDNAEHKSQQRCTPSKTKVAPSHNGDGDEEMVDGGEDVVPPIR